MHVVEAHPQLAVTEAVVTGIHARQPSARVLVLAERFTDPTAFAFLRLGVKGLVTYAEADARPAAGARDGRRRAASGSAGRCCRGSSTAALCTVPLKVYATGFEGLTRRERQVLEAVLDNLSNKEIARRLQMSERTAKFHVSNLLVKHGVRRRADLLFRALQEARPAVRAPTGPRRLGPAPRLASSAA